MNDEDWDWFDEKADADPESGGAPASGERDERLQAGAEHLRTAAREMIAASRALLDVAEELVEDPHAGRDLAGFIGSLGSIGGKGFAPWSADDRPDGGPGDEPDDPAGERSPIS